MKERTRKQLVADLPAAIEAGANRVVAVDGDVSLAEIRANIAEQRAAGAEIVGCSFCARMQPPPGAGPQPCPVCDTVITRQDAPSGSN